ncbi:Uu.00g108340.m01.CDS01 [Anthostomella pinea]|uniref:Uu.00g108340.m01.CDS01 n=1 Tax=Anthostomella pinea TaxID=933095 RepID=A0AAI8V9D2_9PEZI|nr:Uu.00g108340.m01.CDS01 [Anthostomella pinea]
MAPRLTMPPLSTTLLLWAGFLASSANAAITSQFQNFYPQHGDKYEYILHHNCSTQFANYLTGRTHDFPIDWLGGGSKPTVLTEPVILCLLNNVSEYIKSASASAQVLLGITPTLLALLGASTEELAMLTVLGRRPLLALFLSIGSPAVYVSRAFEFHDPRQPLRDRCGRYHLFRPASKASRWALAAAQYAVALAAAANIATLNWELGVRTACTFWTETIFAPLLWGILSVPIHIAGTLALRLRVRRTTRGAGDDDVRYTFAQWLRATPRRVAGLARSEWTPCAAQDELRVVAFDEGKTFISWAWLLSTCTIIHILFGTLLLSSLLFVGPQDALGVIVRYMASVLACRVVLMFEIAGMRERYVAGPSEDGRVERLILGREIGKGGVR